MSLRRSGGPARRTPLGRGDKPLNRGTGLARGAGLNRAVPMPRTPPDDTPPRRRRSGHGAGDDIPTSVRAAVHDRDGGCARCGETRPPHHVHHRSPRGRGGRPDAHRLANLLLLCAPCHLTAVESYREQARDDGYLIPAGVIDPATVPVLWWDGQRYLLDDDGNRTTYREEAA